MKKVFGLLVSAFLVLGLMSTSAFADAAKGQKYYLKYMKDGSGMNGAKFATQHTQAEWKALFDGKAEKFVAEYSKKYPGLDGFLKGDKFEKFMPDIRDFCVEFASDSGNVPSC
ncbi:hypothetical protein SJPD1_2849 [Sulfurospirillum diekertiae]|uniref:Uncharacterized protein n=1 Tax=Sulfurospirillum diekertiae TaxID=1854492 RepID=A0A290HYJ2_9BACT|nr:hypothetical protein [Sulfurospirillum diekertiae]ARU50099.1 hypothetical protein Sdiek1_2957 [Sulfurospirillum diekertiae]ASC94887.1 hypothetical protein Sdiek2_2891 [Sulfurospirillum diekertiae]ATB70936.1 hypothetical protein SJPD1_2848 [Sulfurospirillum diekertiae]ATB70937.1 hypothetical protein SJPD1_2849 [Sulfurospirillum diekertiae]